MVFDASDGAAKNHPVRTVFRDPVPDEIEGDVFDRQRVVTKWNQRLVEQQTCFVLGTGGLGQAVALGLCRLGVKKVFLLDRDVYDATNLTRQVLGGVSDVGLRKVDVAARNLRRHHNLRTTIETMHMDAVLQWSDVVAVARQCNVVFNCIDFGGMFDYAVNSLCKELQLPYVAGSSYAWSTQVEYFTGLPDKKCWACINTFNDTFNVSSSATRRADIQADVTTWLASQRVDGSHLSPTLLSAYLSQVLNMRSVAPVTEAALADLGKPDGVAVDQIHDFLAAVRDRVLLRLAPGSVGACDSIEWVPREVGVGTRSVGSWCGVCVGAGMLMVNAFVQGLMGELGDEFPNTFELAWTDCSGSTDRTYGAVSASDVECKVCKTAVTLHEP